MAKNIHEIETSVDRVAAVQEEYPGLSWEGVNTDQVASYVAAVRRGDKREDLDKMRKDMGLNEQQSAAVTLMCAENAAQEEGARFGLDESLKSDTVGTGRWQAPPGRELIGPGESAVKSAAGFTAGAGILMLGATALGAPFLMPLLAVAAAVGAVMGMFRGATGRAHSRADDPLHTAFKHMGDAARTVVGGEAEGRGRGRTADTRGQTGKGQWKAPLGRELAGPAEAAVKNAAGFTAVAGVLMLGATAAIGAPFLAPALAVAAAVGAVVGLFRGATGRSHSRANDPLHTAFRNMGDAARNMVNGAAAAIGNLVGKAVEGIKTLLGKAVEGIGTLLGKAKDAVVSAFKGEGKEKAPEADKGKTEPEAGKAKGPETGKEPAKEREPEAKKEGGRHRKEPEGFLEKAVNSVTEAISSIIGFVANLFSGKGGGKEKGGETPRPATEASTDTGRGGPEPGRTQNHERGGRETTAEAKPDLDKELEELLKSEARGAAETMHGEGVKGSEYDGTAKGHESAERSEELVGAGAGKGRE